MLDILELIISRRTIRKFKNEDVPDTALKKILEAARWAPSWANTQCWRIMVIKEQKLKEELAALLTPKNPAIPSVKKAPIVLGVCAELEQSGFYKGKVITKFGDWFMYDLGLMTENIVLSAHALGLGSVIVGAFDHDKAKEMLHLPQKMEIVTLIPLGYPDQAPSPPKRKELGEFVYLNTFAEPY